MLHVFTLPQTHKHLVILAHHQATEERVKRIKVMSNGPQRLGGGSELGVDWRLLSPAQAAAIAAERRAADSKWCGAGDAVAEGAAEGLPEYTVDVPSDGGAAVGPSTSTCAPPAAVGEASHAKGVGVASSSAPVVVEDEDDVVVVKEVRGGGLKGTWTCTACTYVNDNPLHLACAVCGTARS